MTDEKLEELLKKVHKEGRKERCEKLIKVSAAGLLEPPKRVGECPDCGEDTCSDYVFYNIASPPYRLSYKHIFCKSCGYEYVLS